MSRRSPGSLRGLFVPLFPPLCHGDRRLASTLIELIDGEVRSNGFLAVSRPDPLATTLPPGGAGIWLPGEAVSENGTVHQGASGHRRDARRRRGLVLPTLSPAG